MRSKDSLASIKCKFVFYTQDSKGLLTLYITCAHWVVCPHCFYFVHISAHFRKAYGCGSKCCSTTGNHGDNGQSRQQFKHDQQNNWTFYDVIWAERKTAKTEQLTRDQNWMLAGSQWKRSGILARALCVSPPTWPQQSGDATSEWEHLSLDVIFNIHANVKFTYLFFLKKGE